MRSVLALALLGGSGCVNDYLVGDGDGSSSTAGAPGSSTGVADTGSSSSGACPDDGCGDSTKADGDGTGQGDTVGDMGGVFECNACTNDASCGDDVDNCVAFDMLGPLCLRACPDVGCPAGTTCRNVISVDGAEAMQCAPVAGTCDPIGTDGGGDGMGGATTGDPTTTGDSTTGAMTGESMTGSAEG